jgi:frataxin-like iron-binding protein CyaY
MSKLDKEIMISSYNNISFYGEKRGEEDYQYYTELLKSDLEQLGEKKGNNYEAKFIDKVMAIYHRQMRCASAFITGPANFPTRQMQKRWDSRDKAYESFMHWRDKYFIIVNRVKTLSPEAEIDKTLEQIEKLTIKKELLKELNKVLKKDKVKAKELLLEIYPNADQFTIDNIIGNDREKVPSYIITSLTNKIRERKKKIEVMKARIEVKNNQKPINFEGGSIYIENDRVVISHDEKPDREIIQAIKSNGFRWSPKFKNWCRKHTANSIYSANYLLNNVFGGEI